MCIRDSSFHAAPARRSKHLKQVKLQIIRLVHTPQDGMVRRLLARLDLAQLNARVTGRVCQDVYKRQAQE